MGRDGQIACKTCRINYYLGYGSYTTWIYATNLEEAQRELEKDEGLAKLTKNQNLIKVLEEHQGHDLLLWSNDWCYETSEHLVYEGGWPNERVAIEDYDSYQQVNLWERNHEG